MPPKIDIPRIITHENMQPLLEAIQKERYFQIGVKQEYNPEEWFWTPVILEVPTGELCKDHWTTLGLVGRSEYQSKPLTGKEGFNAQGLEGKVEICKPLFNALMNLRDLIPEQRGRIIVEE